MRILYVTEYQGAAVVAQRRHRRNRALGAARKVELFATALKAGGHEVHIVSTGAVSERTARWYRGFTAIEPACAGAAVSYLPGIDLPRVNLLYAGAKLRSWFRAAPGIDVVLLYNLEWLYLRSVIDFCRRAGIPLAIEYEDDALQPIVGQRFAEWHRRRGRRSVEAARSIVTGVAAVSEKLRDQLGVSNSIVVPGAVDDSLLALHPSAPDEEAPLRVLYAGSLTRAKGVQELLEAVSSLGGSVVLDIVGIGPEYEPLQTAIARRRIPAQMHGEVSRDTLSGLYAAAHLAVNPHVMTEEMRGGIFPFKIAEYIGAGLPVVTTALPAVPSALGSALVTARGGGPQELAQALLEARRRYADLAECVRRARTWIGSEFSTTALAVKLDVLLQAAAGARRGRA